MRTLLITVLLLSPSLAKAWDDQMLWNSPANGGNGQPGAMGAFMPGGGGIYGTGGARDYRISCASCHVNDQKQQGQIDARLTFTPSLESVGGQQAYAPGKPYTVTVELLNEQRGKTGCGPYVTGNINNFAASIEDSAGKSAGILGSDTGQSAAACPKAMPVLTSGSTILYGDCHAVTSMGSDKRNINSTSWTFQWTAPAAGAGLITVYWGVVDGDCMMDSLGDDVKVGTTKLVEGTASLAPRSGERTRQARRVAQRRTR